MLTRLCLARHVQNQSRITLMRRICSFHGFFYSIMICLRLPGAGIVTDYLLLGVIQRRIGANAIRVRFATEFFLTRIYRIDADASFVGRYCLPDSSHYMLYKSRDFVPGYSRFARYWLPAKTGYDYLLLKSIERRVGAKTIRSKSNIKWQHKIK